MSSGKLMEGPSLDIGGLRITPALLQMIKNKKFLPFQVNAVGFDYGEQGGCIITYNNNRYHVATDGEKVTASMV